MDYRDGYIESLIAERSDLRAQNKALLVALEECLVLNDIAPAAMFESIHAKAREAINKTKGGES